MSKLMEFVAARSMSIHVEQSGIRSNSGPDCGGPESDSVRPLSISIIGWVMVGSGLFSLPMAFLHVPLAFLGMILGGWSAMAGIIVLALAYLLIGHGLLHLKPKARVAGIALVALLGLNGLIFSFIPGTHAKMLDAMKSTPFLAQPVGRRAPPPIPSAFRLLMIPVIGVPLWFLVTRKKAFEHRDDTGASRTQM